MPDLQDAPARARPLPPIAPHIDLRGEPLPREIFVRMLMEASGMPVDRARRLVNEVADTIEAGGRDVVA